MNNVIEKIKKAIREYDPDIKFSDSSALTDLMINPQASILAPFQNDLDKLKREQSLADPETISETEMDRYGSNFFVSRDQGTKATGYVRIYFRTPRSLFIGADAYFETADGKKYNMTGPYSITDAQMRGEIAAFPLYSTGLIPIVAAAYGTDQETPPNTIAKVVGVGANYVHVRNPVAITGGGARETNTQLKSRILDSTINKSLMSEKGIQTLLMSNFSSLTDVVVIGTGDDEMERDLVYTTPSGEQLSTLPSNFYRSDYFGSVSGITALPGNRSRGYQGVFHVEVPVGSGIQVSDIPVPTTFTEEWTTIEYSYLYRVNDSFFLTIKSETILQELFSGGTEDNDEWVKEDGSTTTGSLLNDKEINVENGIVRLGVNSIPIPPDIDKVTLFLERIREIESPRTPRRIG